MSHEFNSPQLPAMGLVAGLEVEDRMLLSGYGEFLPVHENQILIEEGEDQDALYFVISGILDVYTERDQQRTPIARIEAGESVGEINIFDPGKASASVTSQSFSQVWKATRSDFEAFVEAYPEAGNRLLVALIAELSRRMRHANEKLITMALEKHIAVETVASYKNYWD